MSNNAIGTQPHTLNSPRRATQIIFDRETGAIHGAHHVIIGPGSHDAAREVHGQSVRDAVLRRTAAAAGLPIERLELMSVSDLASTDLASLCVDVARGVLVSGGTSHHASSRAASATQPRPRRPA